MLQLLSMTKTSRRFLQTFVASSENLNFSIMGTFVIVYKCPAFKLKILFTF
jgi:hypothetical protein